MRLTHLMDNRIVIARKIATSGIKSAMSTVTVEMAHKRLILDSKTAIAEGRYAKLVRFYFEGDTDVQDGDRFRDEDGKYYTVVSGGVNRMTYGSIDFLQVDTQQA